MNILYISKYTVLPEFGAPTRQYFLSKYLSKLGDNKVMLVGSRSTLGNVLPIKTLFETRTEGRLELITLAGPKVTLGFNLKRIWSWIVFEFNLLRFRKKIRQFRPDIVLISSLSILTFIYGVFLKKWLKVPLVLEIRDLYPTTLVEVGGYRRWHPAVVLLGLVERIGYRHADLIISTLPKADRHISAVLKCEVNFRWFPMGVDLQYFSDSSEGSKTTPFEKKTGDFYVGYAGTIGRANALDVLFEAASLLEESYPKIKFFIIGEGPLKEYYKEKFCKLQNLYFLPAVSKKDLQPLLRNMDVLVNPWLNKRIYDFGISPNKWIDYMFAARPLLVAFNGYDQIICEAKCGVIVPAEDPTAFSEAIIDLVQLPKAELTAMGENGRMYLVNKLNYANIAKDLYSCLLKVKLLKNE